MTAYSELTKEVNLQAKDAPEFTVERSIGKAARQFCQATDAYRYKFTLTPVKGIAEIELDPPTGTRVNTIIAAKLEDKNLKFTSDRLLHQLKPDFDTDTGTPTQLLLSGENKIRLVPISDKTLPIKLKLVTSLVPTRAATTIDDAFFEEYADAFIAGALRDLLMQSGTPWYNPNLAQVYEMEYSRWVDTARHRANQDNTPKRRLMAYGGY